MTTTQIFARIEYLDHLLRDVVLTADEHSEYYWEREELRDELISKARSNCGSQHFARTVSSNGYDICFNCGAK